jgi:thioredoxin-like negative regulator of GroEL
VLYFRSDSCATCSTQSRFLTQLREWMPVSVETIDVQAEPQRAADFGVMTLPTTIVVGQQGNVKQINYGLTSATQLARQLEN